MRHFFNNVINVLRKVSKFGTPYSVPHQKHLWGMNYQHYFSSRKFLRDTSVVKVVRNKNDIEEGKSEQKLIKKQGLEKVGWRNRLEKVVPLKILAPSILDLERDCRN